MIENVTVYDTGTYTCEIEANLDNHITISHFLQVLGKLCEYFWVKFEVFLLNNCLSKSLFFPEKFDVFLYSQNTSL